MAPRWYEKAEEQIELCYQSGQIGFDEFNRQMRELNQELRDAAHEEAERAYDDYMGGYYQ
jgi:hypothetical protein